MSASDALGYELLDFGQGRKLERFGRLVLDRPAPAAEGFVRAAPQLWSSADLRFESDGEGRWQPAPDSQPWTMSFEQLALELKPTPFGHVGVFPEHATAWRAVAEVCRARQTPPRVLNLFAYTGGATLAAAAVGAHVTHVDAADNVVRWARRNAELSGLAERPIRWIVDDARKFVAREARRGRQYDAVLLDPPAFGHGPRGERWSIDDDLAPLLAACRSVLAAGAWLALSSHSQGYGTAMLAERTSECTGQPAQHQELALTTRGGRRLPAGALAWSCAP